jgi:hypothetical protein
MLILAVLSALLWGATLVGAPTRARCCAHAVLLGLVAFLPATAAFNRLGICRPEPGCARRRDRRGRYVWPEEPGAATRGGGAP